MFVTFKAKKADNASLQDDKRENVHRPLSEQLPFSDADRW